MADLLLNLAKIRGSRQHVERLYQPGDVAEEDDYRILDPMALAFDLHKTGDEYRLVGHVRTRLGLPCSRCLEEFTRDIDAPFDLLYIPQTANVGEGEREVQQEDLGTAFYRDDTIDLGQLMREQFYLTLPMKPLCREACAGLCPACGTNLNTGSCDCRGDWPDPRLAALKTLLNHDR